MQPHDSPPSSPQCAYAPSTSGPVNELSAAEGLETNIPATPGTNPALTLASPVHEPSPAPDLSPSLTLQAQQQGQREEQHSQQQRLDEPDETQGAPVIKGQAGVGACGGLTRHEGSEQEVVALGKRASSLFMPATELPTEPMAAERAGTAAGAIAEQPARQAGPVAASGGAIVGARGSEAATGQPVKAVRGPMASAKGAGALAGGSVAVAGGSVAVAVHPAQGGEAAMWATAASGGDWPPRVVSVALA